MARAFRGSAAFWMTMTALLAAAGCGSKANDAAKAINALFGQGQSESSVVLRQAARMAYEKGRAELDSALLSARLGALASHRPAERGFDKDFESDFGCTDCAGSGDSFCFTCTTTTDQSVSCGGTTYVTKAGATISMEMAVSATAFTFAFDMNGTVTGGDFGSAGSTFDCNMGMSIDLAKLQAGDYSNGYEVSCSDTSFSCKMGSTTISCSDLNKAMESKDNACTS